MSGLPHEHSWCIPTSGRGLTCMVLFRNAGICSPVWGWKKKWLGFLASQKRSEDLYQIGLKISKLHWITLKLACSRPPPSEEKQYSLSFPFPWVYLKFFLRSQRAPGWDRPSTSRLGSSVPYAPSVQCDPTLGDFRWVFPVFTICWECHLSGPPKTDVLAIFVCRSPFFHSLENNLQTTCKFCLL